MDNQRCTLLLILSVNVLSLIPLSTAAGNVIYNVQNFGAKANGISDSTKAFLSTWSVACASTAKATIYVPQGRYLLGKAVFSGQLCKSNGITLRIDGTLVAPADYNVLGRSGNWIQFIRVNGLTVLGGTLDGQGARLWACKNSGKNNCPTGATAFGIYHSDNVLISGLTSLNSQHFHIIIYGCKSTRLQGMKIIADGESPNTDGIHVMLSSGISITNSKITTGDDCISIGPGSSNLWIENIACGPGHGISIGSLGWDFQEPGVENVTVKTVTFTGTQNGFRVKTWSRPSNGFVRGVLLQNAIMVNVENPIIIDQYYCPSGSGCLNQASGVRISDITYQNVRGTSATKVAVKLNCSKHYPCRHITLDRVNLSYNKQTAIASCLNARGNSFGVVNPTGCLLY